MEFLWNGNNNVMTIVPPDSENRENHTIISVVDLSYSMDAEVVVKNELNLPEHTGLSVLDLVIYTVKMTVNCLTENDMFGLVVFSNSAEVVIEPVNVTAENKEMIMKLIDEKLYANGSTNLWDGVKCAIEMAENMHNASILVFTDGQPNIHPPMGYKMSMERAMADSECAVHTFGYSNGIDSSVLFNISNIGRGTYNFIPDGGMLATVFVHSIANILSEMEMGRDMVIAGYKYGTLRCGQPRQYILPAAPLGAIDNVVVGKNADDNYTVERIMLCDFLEKRITNKITTFQKLPITDSDMKYDLEGEIKLAFENYDTWGKCFLPSIYHCYKYQICNNFKDKGIQRFAVGKIFNKERDNAENIFKTMDPPKPSVQTARVVDMTQTFYNCNSSCFSDDSKIKMHNGTFDYVKNLIPGSELYDGNTVVYIVKAGQTPMLEITDGLYITAYHPINIDGIWKFPISHTSVISPYRGSSFNIVTTNGTVVMGNENNEVIVATLGWGKHETDEKVLDHDFFGTSKVVDRLSAMAKNGYVNITGVVRNKELLIEDFY